MGYIGKLIGGGIGLAIGGPLGAIVGVGLGHLYDKGKDSIQKSDFTYQQKAQTAFYACFFGCIAKMMKADGVVTRDEVECLKKIISEVFRVDGADRKAILEIVQKAKDDGIPANHYIDQLAQMVNYDKNLGTAFISALYKIAMADNILHVEEKNILYYTGKVFRLGDGMVDGMIGNIKNSTTSSLKDAYVTLDCTSDMSNEEIKKAYRKKCLEFHPDKLM